jgi:hypothetical protein
MHAQVEARLSQVAELCRKHGVRQLFLFGSATGDGYQPGKSDIDLLVEFQPAPPAGHADNYFGLLEDLESLLGSRVDLVELDPIRNPYLRRSIEATKVPIYDAA